MNDLILATDAEIQALEQASIGHNMRPVFKGSMAAAINAATDKAHNATLRKDEWERIDDRVNEEARNRLTVMDSFRSRGLVQPVGIGDILRVSERLEVFSDAELSFDGDVPPEEDRPSYLQQTVPVPVISKGFRIGWRQLASSQRRGNNLQTDSAGLAARAVTHRIEALITNGLSSGGPNGNGIPGLTTASNRIQLSLATNWDASGADIIGDVERMLDAAYTNFLFGPFVLQVPKNYWATLQGDYSDQKGDRTYLERIEAFADIDSVMPNDQLADDNVLLVQMTRDSMDVSEAQTITTWQWNKTPAVTHYRVIFVGGPHIKDIETEDETTVNGIVHLS